MENEQVEIPDNLPFEVQYINRPLADTGDYYTDINIIDKNCKHVAGFFEHWHTDDIELYAVHAMNAYPKLVEHLKNCAIGVFDINNAGMLNTIDARPEAVKYLKQLGELDKKEVEDED